MIQWFKYVPEGSVESYHRMGWIIRCLTYDGHFQMFLMEYICCCRHYDSPPLLLKRKQGWDSK